MNQNNQQLTKRSLKAGLWLGSYRFYARFINLLKTPVLTRIFLPAELGVFGIVSIALNLLETFSETGIEQALIHQKKISKTMISTAWFINLVRSILVSLLLYLTAPLFAYYFKTPQAETMIQVISVTPILRSLRNPSMIFAKRNLQFGRETLMLVAGSTTEVIVTLVISLMYQTVWALVWAIFAAAFVELLVSYLVFRKPVFAKPSWLETKKLASFGKWVWSSSALSFLANQGDDVIVGKVLGTGPLALYQYAYKVASLPATQIAGTVSQITFPAFATIQKDQVRLKRALKKSLLFVTFTTVPILLVVFLFPRQIVGIVFGENWLEAAPALRILSLYGIIRSYANTLGPLAVALGKPQFITYNGVIHTVILFVLIIPLSLQYGIVGASSATLIAIICANLVLMVNLKGAIGKLNKQTSV